MKTFFFFPEASEKPSLLLLLFPSSETLSLGSLSTPLKPSSMGVERGVGWGRDLLSTAAMSKSTFETSKLTLSTDNETGFPNENSYRQWEHSQAE